MTDQERAREWWAEFHNHAFIADEEAIIDLAAQFAAVRAEGRQGGLREAREVLRGLVELLDGQTEPLHPVSWQVELAAAKAALSEKGGQG